LENAAEVPSRLSQAFGFVTLDLLPCRFHACAAMARRLRQHINPLKQTALVPRPPLSIPTGPAVEVELGCGDGLFMVERAVCYPERLFFGLDIREAFLEPGRLAVAKQRLNNVRLETCNLSVDAAHLFPAGRIDLFWINFPDPWFKRRQRNRRWLDGEVLASLVDALKPNGRLIYQSDVWELAVEALGLLEGSTGLDNLQGSFTFRRDPIAEQQTSRERACTEEGRRIWRLDFRRIAQ
jgi:tRNA (guanine-N7-)-methyltransferase